MNARFVTLRVGPAVGALLASRGFDAAHVFELCGVPVSALAGPVTISLSTARTLTEYASETLGTDRLGLEVAMAMPGPIYGIVDAVMRAAPTVAAALHALCELAPLIDPNVSVRYHEGTVHFSIAGERDTFGAQLNELWMAYLVRRLGGFLGEALPIETVWFSHTSPASGEHVAAHFRCPVRFGAEDCGITLPPETLAMVPRTADAMLFDFLVREARQQLVLVGRFAFLNQVTRVIESKLAGEVTETDVANAMGISPYTLHRFLAYAGTTFHAVVWDVRVRRPAATMAA